MINKRALNEDQFTDGLEAVARSLALGLDGETHVHDVDGQAIFMPGSSHEVYLARMAEIGQANTTETEGDDMLERTVRAIMSSVIGKGSSNIQTDIVKMDDEQRIVWGWASVISKNGEPVFDTQGDHIAPDVMVKAANEFMLDARIAKAMHEGDQIGEVIHSFPLTDEIGKAIGVQSDREGWIIAMKVHDDDVWKRVKSGELKAFSIGGKAMRHAVEE